MNEEQQQSSLVPDPARQNVRKSGAKSFVKGHLKPANSGRRKNSVGYVKELAESLNINVFEIALKVVRDGTLTTIVAEDGKRKRVDLQVSLEERLNMLRWVGAFIAPRLTASQITADIQSEVHQTTVETQIDMTKLLSTPEGVHAAQTIALLLAGHEDAPAALETAAEPITDATNLSDRLEQAHAKDSTGDWRPR